MLVDGFHLERCKQNYLNICQVFKEFIIYVEGLKKGTSREILLADSGQKSVCSRATSPGNVLI